MLTRIRLNRPQDKSEWLDRFRPHEQTWLVSDLKSKMELQTRLLQREPAIESNAILRASELWRRLLWTNHPERRMVSMDLVRSLVQRELREHRFHWAKGAGAAHSLTAMMPQFLPLFAQLDDLDVVRQWLQANPDSFLKWGHWFELATRVWQVLDQEKMIPAPWAPAFLLSFDTALVWDKEIWVDLSAQLSPMEDLLLKRLAESTPVTILEPDPLWNGPSVKMEDLRVPGNYRMARFSSPLAEVKDAVSQVRRWLDAGAKPESIALIAPEIETYWPLLGPALEQEGIPVNKARTVPFHTLPAVQGWLAILRLKLGRIESTDLELAAYQKREPQMPFDRFKRFFSHLYSDAQLEHDNWLKSLFVKELDLDQTMSRDEFVVQASRLWQDPDLSALERLLKALLEDSPARTSLSAGLWLDWLEAWAAKLELTVVPAVNGVHAVNVMAAEWLALDHLYMLGLCEENLRNYNAQGLSALEAARILQDLGVVVPSNEQATLEFESRWLLEKSVRSGVLSSSVTDPAGHPLTPSRLWLVQNENPAQALANMSPPGATRWDELQISGSETIARLRNWPEDHLDEMLAGLEQDLGLQPLPSFGAGQMTKLSPSGLEKFNDCPFMYAAERIFLLSDLPVADLDLDPMTRGNLIHKVFERLTEEPRRYQWSNGELGDILDEARAEADLPDFGLWPQMRSRLVEQAQRFLRAEEEWKKNFPATVTVARELPFKAAWSRSKSKVIKADQTEPGDLSFSGRIDRVDSSRPLSENKAREYVVLDYKSSLSDKTVAVKFWVEKNSFQLGLYSDVVESGLTDLPAAPVRASLYYSAKDFNRTKGMHVEGDSFLLPPKARRNSGISEEQKHETLLQLRQRISELLHQADEGRFQPDPKKPEDCPKCKWRSLCRAPHLN